MSFGACGDARGGKRREQIRGSTAPVRPTFLSLTYLYNWFYSTVTYSELNICVIYFSYERVCRWWFSNPPEHEIGTISHLEAESKWPPSGLVEWSLMDSYVLRHVNCHYVVSVWEYKAAIIKWILRGPIAYASTCFCFMMWLSIIFDLWFRRHFNKVIVLHIHNKLLRFVWEWWVMYLGSNEGNGEQVCCRWGHQEGIHRAGGGTAGICNDRRL